MPTERKLSNSGAVLEGGFTFQQRFDQFLTPAETKCYDRIDTMGTEPAENQLQPDANNHVFINEFHFRNFDTNKPFVRVVGPKGADASNYKVISYQGRDGSIHTQHQLSGTFASPDDHSHFGYVKVDLTPTALRKGKQAADGLALVNSQTGACLQFLSYASEPDYERSFLAQEGECAGSGASVPIPSGITEARDIPAGKSLQLVSGTGNRYQDFTWAGPFDASTGTENAGQILTAL